LFNIVLEFVSKAVSQKKKIRGIQTGKVVELSLAAEEIILHLKDPKNSMRSFLYMINTFGKVTGYKNQHTNQ
jgi:hypothetical protein